MGCDGIVVNPPTTLVMPCIFPAVEVVGLNLAPLYSRPCCLHQTLVHPAVWSFYALSTLTSILKHPHLTLEPYSLVVITIDYSLLSSSLLEPHLSTLCLVIAVYKIENKQVTCVCLFVYSQFHILLQANTKVLRYGSSKLELSRE